MKNPDMIKATFVPEMIKFARTFDGLAKTTWLSNYRKAQLALFEQTELPNEKTEHFKYNDLSIFSKNQFSAKACTSNTNKDLSTREIVGLYDEKKLERLVFINGKLSYTDCHFGSHRITPFADANSEQQNKILAQLNAQLAEAGNNPFTHLNACLTDNGVLIEIAENSPDSTIEILHLIGESTNDATLATQLVIDIADNCRATVVSRSINWNNESQQCNLSTQNSVVSVGKNAHFTHYALQLENNSSVHFANYQYNLYSGATLKAFHASTGGVLKKMDIIINHLGQHAHAFLNGLYAATDTQQIDYHTTINHPLPNGQTDEVFRGIVNGKSEAVFNGRIHIDEGAQKTRAELSNKNLILSDDAVIHTKPELEIYADDVVCAHGATVSRMNNESLNYLRARAIPKAEAELMLSYGFFNEVLDEIEHPAIANYLRPILFKRFG